jgi:hypothetical protein
MSDVTGRPALSVTTGLYCFWSPVINVSFEGASVTVPMGTSVTFTESCAVRFSDWP